MLKTESVVTCGHKYTSGAKTKGYIKNNMTGEIKRFLFNPPELSFTRGATYSEISSAGLSYPLTQFVRGNSVKFELPLYIYDKPYSGLVYEWENYLKQFLPPEYNTGMYQQPDDMLLVMGDFIRNCVLEDLKITYKSFTSEGLLVDEADFTLSLRQV